MNAALPYMLLDQIDELPPKNWLIEGIAGRGEIIGLVAEPFAGKSMLASYIALCVATGQAWFGRHVQEGLVIYVAGERARVTIRRLLGAKRHHSLNKPPIAVVTKSPNVARADEIQQLLRSIRDIERERNTKVVLIIFDTLARAMVGLDENSARDAGLVADGLDRLVAETSATILLLHHTSKGGKDLRGSSAFTGAFDAVLTLKKLRDVRNIKLEQANDGEEGATFAFRLKEVALDDGQEMVIVDPLSPSEDHGRASGTAEALRGASAVSPTKSGAKDYPHLSPDQKAVFDALLKVAGDQNEIRNSDDWRNAAIQALQRVKKRTHSAANQAFSGGRKALNAKGFIEINDTAILIRIQSGSDQNSDRRHRNQKSDQNAPP